MSTTCLANRQRSLRGRHVREVLRCLEHLVARVIDRAGIRAVLPLGVVLRDWEVLAHPAVKPGAPLCEAHAAKIVNSNKKPACGRVSLSEPRYYARQTVLIAYEVIVIRKHGLISLRRAAVH